MKSPRIFSIVPPYILENIIRNGSTDERKWAKKTLQFDQQFRQQRASIMGQTQPDNQSQVQTQEEKLPCDHLTRKVFTADNKRKTPGRLLRDENTPPVGDDAIDELHDALKLTYRFFCEVFARPTIEGDSTLEATAHYGVNFANAFWESSGKRVVFGDGDGRYFERFSVALEVIAHEMTHGLIEAETRLEYRSQPGALCESLADVFGCLVKQYTLNQTVQQADWLMGVGVYTSAVQGIALRSLGQPGTAYDDPVLGKDPQPAHMRDFVRLKNTRNGEFWWCPHQL
jgi:Zn-dependent metalloprotease